MADGSARKISLLIDIVAGGDGPKKAEGWLTQIEKRIEQSNKDSIREKEAAAKLQAKIDKESGEYAVKQVKEQSAQIARLLKEANKEKETAAKRQEKIDKETGEYAVKQVKEQTAQIARLLKEANKEKEAAAKRQAQIDKESGEYAVKAVKARSAEKARIEKQLQQQLAADLKKSEQLHQQTDRVIEKSAKAAADYQIKEGRRIAKEAADSLKQSSQSSSKGGGFFDSAFGGGLLGALAGGALFAGISAGLSQIKSLAESASTKLFDLAKTASDLGRSFGGFELKTGLSAKAVSTLAEAAHLSGKELSDLQRPIVYFNELLVKAQNGSTKAAAALQKIGVTNFTDLETALDQVTKGFNDAAGGQGKLHAAVELFGKKGGPDFISVMAKMKGGFKEAQEEAEKMGLTLTEQDIQASKDFGKAWATLSRQIEIGTAKFALSYADQITKMLKVGMDFLARTKDQWGILGRSVATSISLIAGSLHDNKGDWDHWGEYIAHILEREAIGIRKLRIELEDMGDFLTTLNPFSNQTWDTYYKNSQARIKQSTALNIQAEQIGKPAPYTRSLPGTTGFNLNLNPGSASSNSKLFNIPSAQDNVAFPGFATDPKKVLSVTGEDDQIGAKEKLKAPAEFGSLKTLVISSGNLQWDAWFVAMGQKNDVDPNVLLLQANLESAGKSGAVSPKGAKGFSQFMPATADRFHVDTSSIKDSIRGQAEYMHKLLSMFGGDYSKALAGYNAGEGAVQKYHGIPPFKETRNYVANIKGSYSKRVAGVEGVEYGGYDPEDALSEASDAATKADKEKFYRRLIMIYKAVGMLQPARPWMRSMR